MLKVYKVVLDDAQVDGLKELKDKTGSTMSFHLRAALEIYLRAKGLLE